MKELPSLDAHAHLDHVRTLNELARSGAVLAMTLSLEEAALALNRHDSQIAWGVGCHPRKLRAQQSFNEELFKDLATRTAVVGEIGLDTGLHYSHAPLESQIQTFRKALKVLADLPRIVSIHSYRTTGLVVRELRQNQLLRRFFIGGQVPWKKHGRRWRWNATSLCIQLSPDTRSFARQFLPTVF